MRDAFVAEHVIAFGDHPVLLPVLANRALDHLRTDAKPNHENSVSTHTASDVVVGTLELWWLAITRVL